MVVSWNDKPFSIFSKDESKSPLLRIPWPRDVVPTACLFVADLLVLLTVLALVHVAYIQYASVDLVHLVFHESIIVSWLLRSGIARQIDVVYVKMGTFARLVVHAILFVLNSNGTFPILKLFLDPDVSRAVMMYVVLPIVLVTLAWTAMPHLVRFVTEHAHLLPGSGWIAPFGSPEADRQSILWSTLLALVVLSVFVVVVLIAGPLVRNLVFGRLVDPLMYLVDVAVASLVAAGTAALWVERWGPDPSSTATTTRVAHLSIALVAFFAAMMAQLAAPSSFTSVLVSSVVMVSSVEFA